MQIFTRKRKRALTKGQIIRTIKRPDGGIGISSRLRQSSTHEVSRNNLNLFIINILRKEADMAITKVWIDEDECTQCGLCEDTCPEVFEMGDDSAIVKTGVDFNTYEDAIREAAEDCPSEVIHVE